MCESDIRTETAWGRSGVVGSCKGFARRVGLLSILVFSAVAHAESVVTPVVWVSTVDSEGVSGTVESFAPDSRLVLKAQGPSPQEIPAADVIRIDLMDALTESDANAVLWTTVGGDSIRGRIAGGSDRSVTLRRKDLGDVELPLTQLGQIIFPAAVRIEPTTSAPSGKDDEILLANGDRLFGLVERIDPNGVSVDTSNGRVVLPFDVLRSVRLVTTDRSAATSSSRPTVRARLTLRDGSTLTVSAFKWKHDELGFRIGGDGAPERRLRIDQIVRLEVVGGRWQGLEAMAPEVAEHTPLLNTLWSYRVGRNARGGPLRVGGRLFERGLGVHSRFRLVYDVPRDSERFLTAYALDDDSGDWGHVEVRILVDGRVVHEAREVRKDGQLRRASVDLKGARKLELVVDFGKNGDVQDRLDWIEPGIVRRR